MRRKLLCQEWIESERGCGWRPDGFSLHMSQADRDAYVKAYWAGMPKKTPDEYSKPDSSPKEIIVTEGVYQEVKHSKNGLMYSGKVEDVQPGGKADKKEKKERKEIRENLNLLANALKAIVS